MKSIMESGEWNVLTQDAITELRMRFVPLDLVAHWKRCGMVADFLAHFLAYNFEDAAGATNIISTVLNEILENAVKFSADKHTKIALSLKHTGEQLEIETTNVAAKKDVETLARRMERLLTEDVEELFVQQLEHTAVADSTASGLGLISLKKDYKAELGARFKEIDDGKWEVVFRLLLSTDEIEQRLSGG
jgi:hypothetical protein